MAERTKAKPVAEASALSVHKYKLEMPIDRSADVPAGVAGHVLSGITTGARAAAYRTTDPKAPRGRPRK